MRRRAMRGEESRTEIITVRMTKAERVRLEQRAAAAGLTVSAYSARALGNARVTVEAHPALHPALVAELKRIGNNINQIAYALNARKPMPAREAVLAMRDLLEALIKDEVLAGRVRAFEASRSRPDDSAHP